MPEIEEDETERRGGYRHDCPQCGAKIAWALVPCFSCIARRHATEKEQRHVV